MRTNLSNTETTGKGRRAATTLAILGMALPLSGLLGGTAFAAADAAEAAALRLAGDKGNTTAQAASAKNDDNATGKPAVVASSAANKPADFIGPVAPDKKADAAPAAVKASGPNSNTTDVPFTNTGGVTTGSNTTKYEVVNGRDGSPAVGGGQPSGNVQSPQPFSGADKNNTGANDTSATNQYRSTRDGAPSLNGNGGGQQVGQPCAGCVGKADNKNPPGQAPNGTDRNAGYECDRNHGIGRSNPAHTGCRTTPTTTPKYDCEDHLLPNNHVHDCTPKYDCEDHLLPNNHVHDCTKSVNVTLCHATGSNSNPSVTVTVDHNGALNGHEGHEGDVIPAYSYVNKAGKTVNVPAKNGNGCGTTTPQVDCLGHDKALGHNDSECPKNPQLDCLGHDKALGHSDSECPKNIVVDCLGHDKALGHSDSECPKPDCKGVMGGNAQASDCTPPTVSVCPAGTTQMSDGSCSIAGGSGAPASGPTVVPVRGQGTPPVVITGSPEAPAQGPAEAPGALPFTGTDALLLAQLAALMLLVGGGLVGMSRKKKVLATL